MNKLIVAICFYFPLVTSCLNIGAIISKLISPSLSQILAYLNLALILLGVALFRQNIKKLSKTNGLFFIFYFLYYSFGLLSTGATGFSTATIIATFVPVIYFIGFYFLLSNKEQYKIFYKVITVCFVISAFLTIVLIKLNISLYTAGVHEWELDRAGGITGDANAAAHTSIFAYILFNQLYQPSKFAFRLLKIMILAIIFYSLVLTFSTTGLFVFTIVFFLINYKFFTGIRLFLIAAVIPLFYIGIFALKSQTQNLGLSVDQTGKVNNIINLLTLNFDEVDSSGRSHLVEKATSYIYDHPFIGNGIDFAVDKLVHNTYVGIWVDAGIFTLLFFLYMLFNYLFKTLYLRPELRYFAMSILIVLYIFMISLQSVINQSYLIILFVFVGYIIDHHKSEGNYDKISQKQEH